MIGEWQENIAKHSDTNAFKALYLHMMPSLSRFAASFLKDTQAAEDVVADIFATLWNNRTSLGSVDNLKVYLYASVRNACLTYLEKRNRITFYAFDEMDVVLERLAAPGHHPEDQLISREMTDAIQAAVESMPPKCRMIFRLAREEKLRYKEIAAILNISVRTIDSQMAIAFQRIQRNIVPHLIR